MQMTEAQIVGIAEEVVVAKVGPETAAGIVRNLTLKEFIKVLGKTYG